MPPCVLPLASDTADVSVKALNHLDVVQPEVMASPALGRPLPELCKMSFTTCKATLRQRKPRQKKCEAPKTAPAGGALKAADLRAATHLTQVEDKFLVLRCDSDLDGRHPGGVVLIVDQHAASERVELERLQHEILRAKKLPSEAVHGPGTTVPLLAEERRWLRKHGAFVEGWGFRWRAGVADHEVVVTHVPKILGTFLEPKDLRGVVSAAETSQVGGKPSVPPVILHILAFKACRRAIKFNDHLEQAQMQRLMRELSRCELPFQCAHGRPTVYPLASLAQLEDRGRSVSTSCTLRMPGVFSRMCTQR